MCLSTGANDNVHSFASILAQSRAPNRAVEYDRDMPKAQHVSQDGIRYGFAR